jgi:hypothetical protein
MMVPVEAIQGAAWVVPEYNGNITEDFNYKSLKPDRYWYVKRRFMDRSGWDITFQSEWGTDQDARLDELLKQQQVVVGGNEMALRHMIIPNEPVGNADEPVGNAGAYDYDINFDNDELFDQINGRQDPQAYLDNDIPDDSDDDDL